MIVLEDDCVNQLYVKGLELLLRDGRRQSSRNGPVIVMDQPVTSVYRKPTQRVLFNAARDANPFFHLMEAIWMLAGRNDAAFLTRYAKQLGEYAEADGHIHGAYGHRWRNHFHFDQLLEVVDRLRRNPDDRQAVVTMWDPTPSVERGSHDYPGSTDPNYYYGADDLTHLNWRDRPCNTHVYLRVLDDELDITVCCRSNDAIWGCYGANAVHFSVLQEYLAAAIGVGVGTYYQISNNFHVYDNELLRRCTADDAHRDGTSHQYLKYDLSTMPIVSHPETFIEECERLCRAVDDMWRPNPFESIVDDPAQKVGRIQNRFLADTALNMAIAHMLWKHGQVDAARRSVAAIAADDWRLACAQWLDRRISK